MNLAEIFINEHGRIRSGWRATIFLLALVFLSSVFGVIFGAIFYLFPISFFNKRLTGFFIQNFILLASALFLGWLCGKFLEGLSFRALGASFTKNWLKDFGLGLLFGTLSICFATLITIVFGAASFQLNRDAGQAAILSTLAVSLLVFIAGAAAEEAFFRGYVLQTFTRARLALLAIALTSLFFALAHLRNPNANYIGMLNTILAGIWFSVAYLKTRTLWLAFGLHLAWNWIQGAFLGSPVSGITDITIAPLLRMTNTGAIFLNGGDYGIEGGIACAISLIIFTLIIWFLPFFRPTEEMLILTSEENPKINSPAKINS
ncbi:MAG: CPBP family intramembrane glutamic endopeptidase [Pyrinomonadaceae bacterium]